MDLRAIWQSQAEQQMLWYNTENLTDEERSRICQELLLGLYEEAGELARYADVRRYHLLHRPASVKSNVIDQGVDVLKYLVSVLQLHGATAEEFAAAFKTKTRIVRDRWDQQHVELTHDTRLIITDLDGCVVDMAEFESHINGLRDRDDADPAEMTAALEEVKERFYIHGGFQSLPPLPGAVDALRQIREFGYKLVIVTARPYWLYRRLYGDTMRWCDDNGVSYDAIIFGKDKAEVVTEQIHPARPTWFIEDRKKHCIELTDIGVPVLLYDTPRNRDMPDHPLVRRVMSWPDIVEAAREKATWLK